MALEKPKNKTQDRKSAEYERIGRAIEAVVSSGYVSKKRLMAANFLRGLFFGLGATLGLSIVIAALLYFSRSLSGLPGIGPVFEDIAERVEQTQDTSF